jgi:hypothetical protein
MVHGQEPRPKTAESKVLIDPPQQINVQNRLDFLLPYLVLVELSTDLSILDDIEEDVVI